LDSVIQADALQIPTRIQSSHPIENIIGDLNERVTRSQASKEALICLFSCFISQVEPKNWKEAMLDNNWIEAMQEELLQIKSQDD
jgi:hypothetical protein